MARIRLLSALCVLAAVLHCHSAPLSAEASAGRPNVFEPRGRPTFTSAPDREDADKQIAADPSDEGTEPVDGLEKKQISVGDQPDSEAPAINGIVPGVDGTDNEDGDDEDVGDNPAAGAGTGAAENNQGQQGLDNGDQGQSSDDHPGPAIDPNAPAAVIETSVPDLNANNGTNDNSGNDNNDVSPDNAGGDGASEEDGTTGGFNDPELDGVANLTEDKQSNERAATDETEDDGNNAMNPALSLSLLVLSLFIVLLQ